MERYWYPLLVFLAMGVYGVVHSLLASLGVKARARQWWGVSADRGYRLFYNLFAGISFLPVLALVWRLPDRVIYAIPFPWVILALVGQGLAGVALLVALRQTGVWTFLGLWQWVHAPGAAVTENGNAAELLVRGMYRWVRHPLYTAGLVLIWLLPVMTLNVLALNIGLTVYIVVGAWFEERKLVRQFGQAYVIYQRQTPMLIPIPGRVAPERSESLRKSEPESGGER